MIPIISEKREDRTFCIHQEIRGYPIHLICW